MAEFVQTMKDWRRICIAHSDMENGCHDDCPLSHIIVGGCGAIYEQEFADVVSWDELERRVMTWAAEHPEPVYPTWAAWLEQMGIISKEYGETFVDIPYGIFDTLTLNAEKIQQPIPAEIAEKLGIEPKIK